MQPGPLRLTLKARKLITKEMHSAQKIVFKLFNILIKKKQENNIHVCNTIYLPLASLKCKLINTFNNKEWVVVSSHAPVA